MLPRRAATQEEEAFLLEEETRRAAELRALTSWAPNAHARTRFRENVDTCEAEEFVRDAELRRWHEAQMEECLALEAEAALEWDSCQTLSFAEYPSVLRENIYHASVIRKGLLLLINEQAAEQASYQDLVLTRVAARRLLDVVDTSLHALIQKERNAARRDLADASRQRQAAQQQATVCGRLYSQLEQVKAQYASTSSELESEKEKTVCLICYNNPRDCILLPCAHLLYCNGCIARHRAQQNSCPACRQFISGAIQCHLLP